MPDCHLGRCSAFERTPRRLLPALLPERAAACCAPRGHSGGQQHTSAAGMAPLMSTPLPGWLALPASRRKQGSFCCGDHHTKSLLRPASEPAQPTSQHELHEVFDTFLQPSHRSVRLLSAYSTLACKRRAAKHLPLLRCALGACEAGGGRLGSVAGACKDKQLLSPRGEPATLRVHAARRVPAPLPERPAVTVVAHSRACACMQARRVPAPLPERPAVTVLPHSRACACMRARRVPAPLPERPAVTVVAHSRACACMRARRVPAPLPERPAAPVVQHSRACACTRARRVPAPLPEQPAVTVVQHSRACACMRARRVPAPLPEQPAVTVVQHSEVCACMRARRVPRPLPGRLVATVALHSKV